jgi:hypothetical protein
VEGSQGVRLSLDPVSYGGLSFPWPACWKRFTGSCRPCHQTLLPSSLVGVNSKDCLRCMLDYFSSPLLTKFTTQPLVASLPSEYINLRKSVHIVRRPYYARTVLLVQECRKLAVYFSQPGHRTAGNLRPLKEWVALPLLFVVRTRI